MLVETSTFSTESLFLSVVTELPFVYRKDPLVQYEFQEILTTIQLDKEVKDTVGWTTLFKTPGNRKRMRIIIAIAFFSQWSGNGLA